jgi:hypothetical protein
MQYLFHELSVAGFYANPALDSVAVTRIFGPSPTGRPVRTFPLARYYDRVTDDWPSDNSFFFSPTAHVYFDYFYFRGDTGPTSTYFGTTLEQVETWFHEMQHLRGALDSDPDPRLNNVDDYAAYLTSLLFDWTSVGQELEQLHALYNALSNPGAIYGRPGFLLP